MRKVSFIVLALCLLFNSHTLAQGGQRNESLAVQLGAEGDVGHTFAVDRYSRLICSGGGLLESNFGSSVGHYVVGTDVLEAGSTTTVLNLTGHAARVDDIIVTTSGPAVNINAFKKVCSVTTNTVTLCNAFPTSPSTANIEIWRPMPDPIIAEASTFTKNQGRMIMPLGGVRNEGGAALSDVNGTWAPISTNQYGTLQVQMDTSFGSAQYSDTFHRREDQVFAAGEALAMTGNQRNDNPTTSTTTDGDVQPFKSNAEGFLYTDPVRRGTVTATQPSVNTATSTTILASNTARRYLEIQNNSAASIAISLTGATLTGITASSGNICLVLAAGATYRSPVNFCPTSAITAYQTSGGAITSISVVEGT